ncbi:transposase [Domibacillus sp. A3M-37]
MPAVLNGIREPWSNGLAEGHINRLKLIKRSMYGRAHFSFLRTKLLLSQR